MPVPTLPETLSTELLLDAHIQLAPPENVGATPQGRRSIHIVTGGVFSGPRLRGTVRPGGGDWLLSFDGGYNELDVRGTFETDDGALIFVHYHGVLLLPPELAARSAAGETLEPASYYFRTTPRFETGSEKYAWLNTLVTVGYGWFGRGEVGYRVFAVR